MNRSVTAVLFAFVVTGCAHKSVAPAQVATALPAQPELAVAETPPSPDAVAEVEAALKDVSVQFAFDRDLLEPTGMSSLQKLARVLRRHSAVKVMIAGNCDERGTEEYNLLLGQRRAESARKYLSVLGVDDPQLDTISYGAERPVVAGVDEDAYAANRRDDVVVKK